MVLGVDRLLKLVKTKNLVEGLSKRELTNPEGAGFDLRLGKVSKISGKGFLGIDERNSADSKLVAEYNPKKIKTIIFKPGDAFIVTTYEKVNLPKNLMASLYPRSTLHRSGLVMTSGNIHPGYQGEITFLFSNAGKAKMEIELGARIVHIIFWEVSGKTNNYRGQWQGGRITTAKKERQV